MAVTPQGVVTETQRNLGLKAPKVDPLLAKLLEVVDFAMTIFQLLQDSLCATKKNFTGRSQHRLPANAIEKLAEEKTRLDNQLANANFVERAPAEKVDALRERSRELDGQIATMTSNLDALS